MSSVPPENRWLWPFELQEQIGRGGMGEVYRARFVKNDRAVAVKLLPKEMDDPTILKRFEREVEVLREMRHPNIVHTFGGTTDGKAPGGARRYYAMEYLSGGTLQDLLDRNGRLTPDAVVTFATQICAALAFAHGKGVVHRDLKPGNFLLAADGTLKLADFGLAAVREGSKLTAEGRTLGTFRYMAPEQIRGKPEPCPQTDLYSLGVVLFELLTGRPPFRGNTPAETLQMHLKTPPPRVLAHEPHAPPALDALVTDLMQKRIEDRPESAEAVGVRLKEIDGQVSGRARQSTAGGGIKTSRNTPPARRKPAAGGEDADDLTAAPPPRRQVLTPPRLKWAAVAAFGTAAVAVPWAASAAASASRLDRAEARWVAALGAGPPNDRAHAARVLGELGGDGRDNFAALTAALGADDPFVRAAAAGALANFPDRRGELNGPLNKLQRTDEHDAPRQAAMETARVFEYGPDPGGAPPPPAPGTPWLAWACGAALAAAAGWTAVRL